MPEVGVWGVIGGREEGCCLTHRDAGICTEPLLPQKDSEMDKHTDRSTKTLTHATPKPQATPSPSSDPPLHKHPCDLGTWPHLYIRKPITSLIWLLTCVCPPAAHGPETEQPQTRDPRCSHPGPERSATAPVPENHRDRGGGFLSSHGVIQRQEAASPWGAGPRAGVAGGLDKHPSLSEAQPQALG